MEEVGEVVVREMGMLTVPCLEWVVGVKRWEGVRLRTMETVEVEGGVDTLTVGVMVGMGGREEGEGMVTEE